MMIYNYLLISIALLSGCALVPNGLKPKSELMKDPEYVKFLDEQQQKQDIEIKKFLGLANIKTIYLGDFGNQDGSDLVREKVRLALMESSRFQVVENPENADAVLTGVAGVDKSQHHSVTTNPYTGYSKINSSDSYSGLGILRLLDSKKNLIWNFEYQRGFMLGGSVSTRVADQIVNKLLDDSNKVENLIRRTPNNSIN